MVAFKVGDRITLCASIRDFCSATNFYITYDVNCSLGLCNIAIPPPFTCLPGNGQTVQFYWITDPGVDTNDCRQDIVLKTLGSAITDSSGIASMQYDITQTDLDLYNIAGINFDLMACIVETPANSRIRGIITSHKGDNIIIEKAAPFAAAAPAKPMSIVPVIIGGLVGIGILAIIIFRK